MVCALCNQRAAFQHAADPPFVALPTTRVTMSDLAGGDYILSADLDAFRVVLQDADAFQKLPRPVKLRQEVFNGGQRIREKPHTTGYVYNASTKAWDRIPWDKILHIGLAVSEQSPLGVLDIEYYFPRGGQSLRTALSPALKQEFHTHLRAAAMTLAPSRARDTITMAFDVPCEAKAAPCSANTMNALHQQLSQACASSSLGAPVLYVQSVGQKRSCCTPKQLSVLVHEARYCADDKVLQEVRAHGIHVSLHSARNTYITGLAHEPLLGGRLALTQDACVRLRRGFCLEFERGLRDRNRRTTGCLLACGRSTS